MPGGDGCDAEAYRGQSWEGCRFICSACWAMGCFVLCKGSAQVGCSGGWSGDVCGIFIFIFLIGFDWMCSPRRGKAGPAASVLVWLRFYGECQYQVLSRCIGVRGDVVVSRLRAFL